MPTVASGLVFAGLVRLRALALSDDANQFSGSLARNVKTVSSVLLVAMEACAPEILLSSMRAAMRYGQPKWSFLPTGCMCLSVRTPLFLLR